MKTVDLSERVTATYYDDEHEEWSQKTVAISDVLDSVCDDYTVIEAEPVVRCKECIVQKICRFAQFLGNEGYCSQGARNDEVEE